jgi:general secretion pathway protein L
MIRTGTVLDIDMAGLGAALRSGWDWWTDELARMVPEGWHARTPKLSGPVAEADASGQIWFDGAALEPVADDARRRLLPLLLPADAVMTARPLLPRLASRDLTRIVALDLDRLLPFPPGTAIAAARALPESGEPGQAKVPTLVAGMPLARAAALVESARAAGIEPLSLIWQNAQDPAQTLDLLPALVASGRITPRRDTRPFWWGLVAALFIANVGVMIGRDVAATNAFAAEVAEQQATSTAARTIAARIGRETTARRTLIVERAAHDPLAVLALASGALPENAWVQRYSWTPESLRLTGYKTPGSDIQSALRRTGRFASLQTSVSDPTAESGGGQPFDITAALAPAGETQP